jgi:hypothetical protein
MNSLTFFIKNRYGSTSSCARLLNVSPQAVSGWTRNNPRNFLRHLPEVCVQCNVTPQYVLNVVMNAEAELIQKGYGEKDFPSAKDVDAE